MIIDFRSHDPAVKAQAAKLAGKGYRCFVDGKEIDKPWYIDTDAGVVKSYDVLGDGQYHQPHERTEWPAGVECLDIEHGGLMSKTICGVVRIEPPASSGGAG